MLDGGRDALRDRWDASERDGELLRLAAGDDLGDDNGAKRFDAAAAISPPIRHATKTYVCMYICIIYYGHAPSRVWAVTERYLNTSCHHNDCSSSEANYENYISIT